MSVVEYVLLFGAVLVGGYLGLRAPGLQRQHLHLVLTVSGAYLLSITAMHLLPEAFSATSSGQVGNSEVQPGWALLVGFFIQLLLEQFSEGVEHGHIHAHAGHSALPVLIGLSVHALLEGSPLVVAGEAVHAGHEHNHLLWGVVLHKIPAGFALSVLLFQAGYRRGVIVMLMVVFASMSPLGALLSERFLPAEAVPYLLAAVSGSLLHVSTTILFELDEPHHHRFSWRKAFAMMAGIGAALLTAYV